MAHPRITRTLFAAAALAPIALAGAGSIAGSPSAQATSATGVARPAVRPPGLSRLLAASGLAFGAGRAGGTVLGELQGVAARTARDVWAVGTVCAAFCGSLNEADHALIEHWNGTGWARVPVPRLRSADAGLRTVSADSAGDGWAAGDRHQESAFPSSFMLHWTGTRWARVAVPKPRVYREEAVAALSRRDVWEVGFLCQARCGVFTEVDATVVLHWDGRSWARVPSPSPGVGGSALTGVTAISARNAWAVGSSCVARCKSDSPTVHTLILHWNGKTWARVPSPSPRSFSFFRGVSTHAAAGVWAVGQACTGDTCRALAVHPVGGRWIAAPTPPLPDGFPVAVDTVSATDAWAVGTYCISGCASGNERLGALVLRWNGRAWAHAGSGLPRGTASGFQAVSAASPTAAWAAGWRSNRTLIRRLNGGAGPAG